MQSELRRNLDDLRGDAAGEADHPARNPDWSTAKKATANAIWLPDQGREMSVSTRTLSRMFTEQEIQRALLDGRAAEPQSPNPYYGRGRLAVAWRVGYRQMLTSRVNQTRQMVAYYRAHAHFN